MSSGKTAWELVWGRYKEAPDTYPGVKEILETLTPKGLFEEPSEYRPICNKKEEERLEKAIIALSSASSKDALAIVKTMAAEHAHRSIWVWATLGDSPLALAIGHLRDLAEVIESTGNPSTRETLAEYYTTQGWKADNSVLRALGAARSVSSTKAVTAAIRVVYLPCSKRLRPSLKPWPQPSLSPAPRPAAPYRPRKERFIFSPMACAWISRKAWKGNLTS